MTTFGGSLNTTLPLAVLSLQNAQVKHYLDDRDRCGSWRCTLENIGNGSIRILDASDDSELAVLEDQTIDGFTAGWEDYSKALPAAAFTATAGTIRIEFRFEADDLESFAGWYLDDVVITTPAP